MVRNISEVLRELGWTSGFNIPVANEDNKTLEQEVEEKIKKKAELIIKLEVLNDRNDTMKNHLLNIASEKDSNQELLTELKKQMENESTMLQMSEFEIKKSAQEVKNMEKEMSKIDERDSILKKNVDHLIQKFEHLKENLEWGEEALFAWEEQLVRGERDTSILQRFKIEDEDRYNQLQVKRKQLAADLIDIKNVEQKACDRVLILEGQLEQTCKLFREVHKEREKLTDVWQAAIRTIHERDAAIFKLVHETDEVREKARQKYLELCEKRNFFSEHQRVNGGLEKDVEKLRDQLSKQTYQSKDLETNVNEFKIELSRNRSVLAELGVRLDSQRSQNRKLLADITAKKDQQQIINAQNTDLQIQIDTLNVDQMTAQQRLQNGEDIYQMGLKRQNQGDKELDKIQNLNFKLMTEIREVKDKIISQSKLIEGLQKEDNILTKEIDNMQRSFSMRQENIQWMEQELFIIDDQIMALTNKKDDPEEAKALEDHLNGLEAELQDTTYKCNVVSEELKISKKAVKNAEDLITQGKNILTSITEKDKELKMKISGCMKDVMSRQNIYNQILLQLNLVKMQVDRTQNNISKKESSVCELESKQIELETIMKEKKIDIEMQRDMLMGKNKTLLEERISLRRSIDHLTSKIRQTEKRYNITMDLLGKSEDGEQLNVTHFKIKSAQEKHELQETGDELEAKINKTEEEILALENTLHLVSSTNKNFKNNLDSVEEDSPEMKTHSILEKEYVMEVEILRESQNQLKAINKEIKCLRIELEELQATESKLQEDWKIKDKEAFELERDLANKQGKLDRATRYLTRLTKDLLKSNDPPTFKRLSQRDIDVRIKAEQNQSALQQIAEFAMNYIETSPIVRRYTAEKELTLPQIRPTTIASSHSVSLLTISSQQTDDTSSISTETSQAASTIYMDPSLIPARDSRTGDARSSVSGKTRKKTLFK